MKKNAPQRPQPVHCGTMEALNEMLRKNPSLKDEWRRNGEKAYAEFLQNAASSRESNTNAGEIVIPVVVHIVYSNPALITDRDVWEQIEVMNEAYAGSNADSFNIQPEFKSLFGKSKIRFTLAKRDPSGNVTTGIERKTTTATYSASTIAQVKHAASGLDAWDVTKYLNIWVCNTNLSVLGIATFPFMTPTSEQGFCIDYKAWGRNPAYVLAEYPGGKTAAHEAGHYFYLYHIWGDDGGACTGSDFGTQTGWPLPAACGDDTPNESDNTFGNMAGIYKDKCSPNAPGIMYNNYMDYSDDVALNMFSKGQICRAEATIDAYRAGLKTSNGAVFPAAANDAYLVNVTPGERQNLNYPLILQGIPVKATIRNLGTSNLTSLNITVRFDATTGGTVIPWTGNLAPNEQTTVTLSTITGLTAGATHYVQVVLGNPNGGTDAYTANDDLQRYFITASGIVTAPFTESFDNATFPPANYFRSNNFTNTGQWARVTTGTYSGAGAVRGYNYNNDNTGQFLDLTLPVGFAASIDSAVLSLRVAHAAYAADTLMPGQSFYNDGLEIAVSADSGRTFVNAYRKTSVPDLRTAGLVTTAFTPTVAQYRLDQVNLTPFLSAAANRKLIIRIRDVNGYGNSIYLDDVSTTAVIKPAFDLSVTEIKNIATIQCLGNSINARATVKNNGAATITSFTVNYRLDNGAVATTPWTGSLASGQAVDVNIPAFANTVGTHIFTVYSSSPNGNADAFPGNDTARVSFSVLGNVNAPLTETFQGTTFPPTGWGIQSAAGSTYGWQKAGAGSNSSAAAYVNNWDNATAGEVSNFFSPVINYPATIDSLFLSFDLSASTYSYPGSTATPLDTLEVLVTKDCGATFTSVYKKWGTDLQTLSAPNAPVTAAFMPFVQSQWRNEKVNLSNYAGNGPVQLVFRNTNNNQNNIYIDNINVQTKTLPARLKTEGYLLYPNPFTTVFNIEHYLLPTTLRSVAVYSAAGQRIVYKNYSGNAPSLITVDLSKYAAGVYIVKIDYDGGKSVSQKVIKY